MPEQLLTVEQFQEMFSEIDSPNAATQLRRPLGVALRRIKKWVGEEVYNAAVAAEDDNECKEDLQAAVGYLTMHFLIANFNTVVRSGGMVKTEKSEGETVLTYFSPDDTMKRSQEFFDLADEMAHPWKLDEVTATVNVVICDE